MKNTPYTIGVIFHYYCHVGDFPRMDTPAFSDCIRPLLESGIIIRAAEYSGQQYEINREAADVYVQALMSVPLPILKWGMP